jgi:hypothetical protein
MSAIRPDKFVSPYETLTAKKAVESGNTQEEVVLHDIAFSDGWKVLTDEMDRMLDELDGSLAEQVAAGADFADIGKTALVKEIVKSYIIRLKTKVSDAREAVQQHGKA